MANGQQDEAQVPAGFKLEADDTTVSGREYPVEFLQAESLDAILAYYEEEGKNPEETVRDIWNSAQKQGAVQSPKSSVRETMDNTESTDADVEEAIENAQAATRAHVIGAPRGSRSGPTQKQAKNFGLAYAEAVAEKGDELTQDELRELREAHGLS